MHENIQQARRTLGHPPRADLDLAPRSDRKRNGGWGERGETDKLGAFASYLTSYPSLPSLNMA
eukprot:6117584-Pyramimonas_sp.AAC.1